MKSVRKSVRKLPFEVGDWVATRTSLEYHVAEILKGARFRCDRMRLANHRSFESATSSVWTHSWGGEWQFTTVERGNDGSDRTAETDNQYPQASGDSGPSTGGASEGTRESPGLEMIDQLEPVRCWRGVLIVAYGNTVTLQSISYARPGGLNPKEHQATCGNVGSYPFERSDYHQAPGNECQCGFYGVKGKADCYGNFIAEVDFYGKVIEHETGYRAEFQRILSVKVQRPEWCMGAFMCDGSPEYFWFPPDVEGKHSQNAVVICEDCAVTKERVTTLSKLAARLGIEVRWDA